jgi:WD40 repeat protein
MFLSPPPLSRVLCLLPLVVLPLSVCAWPTEADKPLTVKKSPGTDQYGDPLPDGALSRLGTTRLRHQGEVGVLLFTPDGKHLASAGADNTFRLWEAATGKERHRFHFYAATNPPTFSDLDLVVQLQFRGGMRDIVVQGSPPATIAVSADGQFLAEGDHTVVRVWDRKGQQRHRFALKFAGGHALAFSPDGKLLVTGEGQQNGTVVLWDLTTGNEMRKLPSPQQISVSRLVFSPDSSKLAGVYGSEIRLWDVASGKRWRYYHGHENAISALAFSPDGKSLASAGVDKTIRLWELASEEEVRKLSGPDTPMTCIAFSPDGQALLSGSQDQVVRLWKISTGKVVREFAGHKAVVLSVAFAPDGKALASACQGGTIRVWDTLTAKERLPLHRVDGSVLSAAFVDGGKAIALWRENGQLRHREPISGKDVRKLPSLPSPSELPVVAFSPDGRIAALAGNQDGDIRLWDVLAGKELRRLSGHLKGVTHLRFSPDGKHLASAGMDQGIRFWKVATGKQLQRWGSEPPLNPEEREIWLNSQRSASCPQFEFSADGKTLAAVNESNQVILWETATGKERGQFKTNQGGVYTLAFSPDGKMIATGGRDEVVRIWDPLTGKLKATLGGHTDNITVVRFAPGGKLLASGSDDGTVRLWDLGTFKEKRSFEGHQAGLTSLAFSLDGKQLLSASRDTTVVIWDVNAPALLPPSLLASMPPARRLEKLWDDLGSADGYVAAAAIGALGELADTAVLFLQSRVQPVVTPDEKRLATLIAELDSDRHLVRVKAMNELSRLEGQASPALKKALSGKISAEATKRIRQLLEKLEVPGLSPEQMRAMHAVEALEQIGSAKAREVLRALSKGAAGARLTQEAREALARLEKQP